jgi:glutamate-5-semialdehyde dehydrogenase
MADLLEQAKSVKAASRVLAVASAAVRDQFLLEAALSLEAHVDVILEANAKDLEQHGSSLTDAARDRLTLTEARVQAMANGLRQVAALPDPLGEVVDGWRRPNGLEVRRVRVPLGVVGIIYENRPNVTSDAAGLCLKSGNCAYLRGSSTAQGTNLAIVALLRQAAVNVGLPEASIALVEDTSHEAAAKFMGLNGYLDCLIPRGGPALIASMREHATVPTILDGDGNCHLYVCENANLAMALDLIENGKMQRPGVCNATETVLVHRAQAEAFLTGMAERLNGVELRGCVRTCAIVERAVPAKDKDYATEFGALILTVKVVDSIDEAIEHIANYTTGHSEAICTESTQMAHYFVNSVDAAAVLVNASTRFVDGEQLGLGAEIGISTQKLHARGPMGLRELTTAKWIITGQGQVRT